MIIHSLFFQCCFTSTKTIRLIRDGSPGRPPQLSHSSFAPRLPLVHLFVYGSLSGRRILGEKYKFSIPFTQSGFYFIYFFVLQRWLYLDSLQQRWFLLHCCLCRELCQRKVSVFSELSMIMIFIFILKGELEQRFIMWARSRAVE